MNVRRVVATMVVVSALGSCGGGGASSDGATSLDGGTDATTGDAGNGLDGGTDLDGGTRLDGGTDGTGGDAGHGPDGGPCTNDLRCWPNASNTGYQNAPGYPGTPGVADPTKLTPASSGSATCPTTFESHHTYSFCRFKGPGVFVGSAGAHLTDVHFVGDLFEGTDPTSDQAMIMLFCDGDCTFDYLTLKPAAIDAPDVPAPKHGTTYANAYSAIMAAGWGAYYSTGHGFSLKHSDIWGYMSGLIVGQNTAATPNLIQDNWMHDQGQCMEEPSCTTHADGIGMVDTGGSSSYITIDHNNMPFITDNTNDIAFQQGTYDHLTITNNILSGDGYTVAIWATSTNVTFTGNVWTNYAQQYFGVNYGQNFWDTPGSVWAHNKFLWDPTGASPFFEGGPGLGNSGPITAADSGKCWVPSGLSSTDYKGGGC